MRQLAGRCKKGHPPPGCPVDTVAARTCVHTPTRDSNSMRRTTSPCRMSCRNGPLANLQSMPRDHFKCFESKGERRGAGFSRYRRECEPSEEASNSEKTPRSEEFRETFRAQPVTNRRSRARGQKVFIISVSKEIAIHHVWIPFPFASSPSRPADVMDFSRRARGSPGLGGKNC